MEQDSLQIAIDEIDADLLSRCFERKTRDYPEWSLGERIKAAIAQAVQATSEDAHA